MKRAPDPSCPRCRGGGTIETITRRFNFTSRKVEDWITFDPCPCTQRPLPPTDDWTDFNDAA